MTRTPKRRMKWPQTFDAIAPHNARKSGQAYFNRSREEYKKRILVGGDAWLLG